MPFPMQLSRLSWLRGRWQATVVDSPNDCSAERVNLSSELCLLSPCGGAMPGVWRLGPGPFLLISIREVEGVLEWRQQEHYPSLDVRLSTPLLVMRGVSVSEAEIILESVGETGHPRFRHLRQIFSLMAEGELRVRSLVLTEGGAWLSVRDEIHRRSAV